MLPEPVEGFAIIAALAVAVDQVTQRVIFPAVGRAIDRHIDRQMEREKSREQNHRVNLRARPSMYHALGPN